MLAPSLPISFPASSHVFFPFDVLQEPSLREKFDRIQRLATSLFDVPTATVSFIDKHHTQPKLLLEEDVADSPYESAFSQYALSQKDVFNVPETLSDERFRNNPYVSGHPNIRFYASCPFQLHHQTMGAISITDRKPRYFLTDQLILLKDLAALVETELQNYAITTDKGKLASALDQARMASMVDPLTGLWNRQGMYNILKHRMDGYLLGETAFALAILDIDGFKKINDTHGHDAGDQTLIAIAKSLIAGCRETDAVGRWGGEEFLLLINESNSKNAFEIAERIRTTIESEDTALSPAISLKPTVTIGLTTILPGSYPTVGELIRKADHALYQGKRGGRNQVVSYGGLQKATPNIQGKSQYLQSCKRS